MQAATVRSRARFANILFATDFSPAAAHAIPYVRALAKHYSSHVIALHVRPAAINLNTNPETWSGDTRRAADIGSKNIKASVVNEKVVLKGTVSSWAERQDAERAAWSAPGVTTVEDDLFISV